MVENGKMYIVIGGGVQGWAWSTNIVGARRHEVMSVVTIGRYLNVTHWMSGWEAVDGSQVRELGSGRHGGYVIGIVGTACHGGPLPLFELGLRVWE